MIKYCHNVVLTILLLGISSCTFAQKQGDGLSNHEILKVIKDEFDCFRMDATASIENRSISLFSYLTFYKDQVNDPFYIELKELVGEGDFEAFKMELINHQNEYWPLNLQSSNCGSNSELEFTSKISKPIFNKDQTKALVIGYRLPHYDKQSLILLLKDGQEWKYFGQQIEAGYYIDRRRKK